MPTTLLVDRPRPAVVLVTLNRPDRLNAIDEVMARELREVCAVIGPDDSARVVVLTGAGRGFCSGIDMRSFGDSMPAMTAPEAERLAHQQRMAALPSALRDLPQPVVAAVNGPAVGGGLALCLGADVRICATSASFGDAAILLGLSGAEMGISYHLPRTVGTSVAADWMLTGRTVSAEEAFRCGLVSELVDDGRVLERALDLAGQMAANGRVALELTKRALHANADAPDLATALDLENRNQVLASTTEEAAAARAKWADR